MSRTLQGLAICASLLAGMVALSCAGQQARQGTVEVMGPPAPTAAEMALADLQSGLVNLSAKLDASVVRTGEISAVGAQVRQLDAALARLSVAVGEIHQTAGRDATSTTNNPWPWMILVALAWLVPNPGQLWRRACRRRLRTAVRAQRSSR
jgi:hypothetical protein